MIFLVPAAFAQDLETRAPTVAPAQGKLQTAASFETSWFEYSNLDFRPLDTSTDQAILDSDDRGSFAFTGASLELAYAPEPQVGMLFAASHRGLWGNDQLGTVNAFGGWVYVNALALDLRTSAGERPVVFRVGRQFFAIGGLGPAPDHVYADVIDGVRADLPLGTAGTLSVLPITVVATSTDHDGADFVSYIAADPDVEFGFEGDTITRRHGTVLSLHGIPGPVDPTAYAFYTDVGAGGTGSDRSYDGLLGNTTDHDWVANVGARALGTFGPLQAWASFDLSTGIDRKESVARDVDCDGWAWGAGVAVSAGPEEAPFTASAGAWDAIGAAYADDGLLYSHGYVGLKGEQAGGLLFNRFLGFHPSAYTGSGGVEDTPQEQERKSGTRTISAELGWQAPFGLTVGAGWWWLADRGITELDLGALDTLTPPYGYAREELAAEERLGATLGHEVDATLGWDFGEALSLQAGGGVIVGSNYYAVEIARVAGDALGSTDPAMPWTLTGGLTASFR